jgi:translation initiation factor 1A
MASQAPTLKANRGGKRAKKMKNHSEVRDETLVTKEEGQEYARVTKVLGSCRFMLDCYDGKTRIGLMRGKNTRGAAKRNNLTHHDDIVLIALRDYEKDKCDIILKYSYDQVKKLVKQGDLPTGTSAPQKIDETVEDDSGFDFENI